jgi:putative ABC transport system permease protein
VGIFDLPDDGEVFFFSWDYMQEAMTRREFRDIVGAFLIIVDEPENVPTVARTIDSLFANSPYPSKTETEKEMVLSFVAFLGNLRLFLAAVCGAVTFTILLVSANTVAMAVRERTRETAILRTLGFTPSEILGMILGEAIMLGAIGGVIGAILASVVAMGMKKALAGMFPFPLLNAPLVAIVIVVAIAVALVSAAVPAWFASRRNVVESLRFAG